MENTKTGGSIGKLEALPVKFDRLTSVCMVADVTEESYFRSIMRLTVGSLWLRMDT